MITIYWKEISIFIGLITGIAAFRLNYLRIAKIKKEIEILKTTEAFPNILQIATFEQVEKYGSKPMYNRRSKMSTRTKPCPHCGGTGKNPAQLQAKLGTDSCMTCSGTGSITEQISDGKGGGCFIATATFDDSEHPNVIELRIYRDTVLRYSVLGRLFICVYYKLSPPLANLIRKNDVLKQVSHKLIITPALKYIRRFEK